MRGNYCVTNFGKTKEEAKMNELNTKTIKGNDGLGTTKVTTHEDKLSVVAEHVNNAYMAVQGILQAHADKNGEETPILKGKKCDCVNNFDDAFKDGYDTAMEEVGATFMFSDFDKSVQRTWKKQDFKDAVSNASLGLTGEAGEVADLIKKAMYHGRGFSDIPNSGGIQKKDVLDELSDVLFYVSAQAQNFGFTLEEVALHNKAKLEKRYEKGFTVEESANKADKQWLKQVVDVNKGGN